VLTSPVAIGAAVSHTYRLGAPSFYFFTAVTVRRGTASVDGVQNSVVFCIPDS
jgi:hypothetical protein